jgi:hypothetical protein
VNQLKIDKVQDCGTKDEKEHSFEYSF